MTLKARNNFTLALASVFLAVCAAALAYYLYRLNFIKNGATPFYRELSLKNLTFFSDNVLTLFFAALCMVLYIPTAAFYLYARFEKTPSNEVAYFVLFLLGCVPEIFKLLVPIEAAPNASPSLLLAAGRALFWGRSLSFVSLFAASLLASTSMNLNAERNIFVILLFSFTIAGAVPVNTTKITNTFNVQLGWPIFLYSLCALAAVLTVISYAIKARENENLDCMRLGVDVVLIEAGFLLLNTSGILAAAIAGAPLLVAGTVRYFANLHKLYS